MISMVESSTMQKFPALFNKGFSILQKRLRTQGLRTTLLWAYGRGLPALTGVPLLQYSQVTPQLYVGPQFKLRGKRMLEQQGFTGCVNMRIERDDAALGLDLAQYLHLPTIDDDAPSFEHLDQGVEFIRKVIREGGKGGDPQARRPAVRTQNPTVRRVSRTRSPIWIATASSRLNRRTLCPKASATPPR